MAQIIDCKKIRENIFHDIKKEMKLVEVKPHLVVISVGDNEASKVYIRNKEKACKELGFGFTHKHFDYSFTEEEITEEIKMLNDDKNVTAIMVQLPLPPYLDTQNILDTISPFKDVDALSNLSIGNQCVYQDAPPSCTPGGIMSVFEESDISLQGKHAVIINRSNIVGKPLAMLMLQKDATVTICHSKTENLADICKTADIIVVGVGKPNFLTADMVKDGAVVIDVGINRLENGKITGDVCFDEVFPKTSYITTVPGGVGVMTVTQLMANIYNTAISAQIFKDIQNIIKEVQHSAD